VCKSTPAATGRSSPVEILSLSLDYSTAGGLFWASAMGAMRSTGEFMASLERARRAVRAPGTERGDWRRARRRY
jgi:hypothetical protein